MDLDARKTQGGGAYGAIAADVEANGSLNRHHDGVDESTTTTTRFAMPRRAMALVALACVGVVAHRGGAVGGGASSELASLGQSSLPDGWYYARGGKHRLRDPWLPGTAMADMSDEVKSANVVNWCRFYGATGARANSVRCGVNCRANEENGANAPEAMYIGTTGSGSNTYRTISRKGADGDLYVCYLDPSQYSGWTRKVMFCPTSGDAAVKTSSANIPDGAKLSIYDVSSSDAHTTNVEYLPLMGNLYTMTNKKAKDSGFNDGMCWDQGGELACFAQYTSNNKKNVNAQWEFIPLNIGDENAATDDLHKCPVEA